MVGCVNYRHMYKKNSQECEADKNMVGHGTIMVSVMALVMGRKGGDVGGLGAGKHQSIVQKSDAKDPLLRLLSVSASF